MTTVANRPDPTAAAVKCSRLLDRALPTCPIYRPPFLVCHCHDHDVVFVDSILDAEGESFEQDAASAVLRSRVAQRCLNRFLESHRDLMEEAGGPALDFGCPRRFNPWVRLSLK